ncbi:MAG: hypothetical protein HZB35_05200 [Nitrospirae bacterium]|nr:hypothetical protein [Nitrospirota bacterium]
MIRTWPQRALALALLALVVGGDQVPAQTRPAADGTRPLQPKHPGIPADPSVKAALSIGALSAGQGKLVYAGSFGMGIYRSEDRGGTWEPASAGLSDKFILCLTTAADGTVYAGTLRGGVFRSKDQGKSWQALNGGLPRMQVKALMIVGHEVYAGTGGGVYRMTTGEDQWREVTKGLEEILVHTLAMGPDRTLFAGTSGKGVMRFNPKDPHGTGWSRMTEGLIDHEGLRENFIRVLARNKQDALYAGTFDGGVFRSGDGGRTWRPISRALPNDSIRGIIVNDKGLFVATGRGIFKSVNDGKQWTPINQGLSELAIQVLTLSPDGALYAGTSSGAFRSDDQGQQWVRISEGLEATEGFPLPF